MPPISYDSLSGDLEGAFSNHNNDDNKSQNRIIACHGVGSDLRMYVQQSDFTIHSTSEHLDKILMSDESCDYFYKIRIPQQIRKQGNLIYRSDSMGCSPDCKSHEFLCAQKSRGSHAISAGIKKIRPRDTRGLADQIHPAR